MKLSVSIPQDDVEFLDYYLTEHDLKTRSAALQQAIRALRDIDLGEQYEAAWSEVHDEDPAILAEWDQQFTDWKQSQQEKIHPDRNSTYRLGPAARAQRKETSGATR